MRNHAIFALSLNRKIDAPGNWIRFPYYHHVFDDEIHGFECQLRELQNFGDFVSIDDATSMIQSEDAIPGRYFCLSFDDGLKSCISGALPVLNQLQIPAVFYLATGYVGRSLKPEDSEALKVFNFLGKNTSLDFLSWNDCRLLVNSGMTIGSHTSSHIRLADHDDVVISRELKESKDEIETRLGIKCDHFCAPYGIPNVDFDPGKDLRLVLDAGYSTFATGQRGAMTNNDKCALIKRDHFLAQSGKYQLQYFMSRK